MVDHTTYPCLDCGTPIGKGWFCGPCGMKPLNRHMKVEVRHCASCGNPMKGRMMFCVECEDYGKRHLDQLGRYTGDLDPTRKAEALSG